MPDIVEKARKLLEENAPLLPTKTYRIATKGQPKEESDLRDVYLGLESYIPLAEILVKIASKNNNFSKKLLEYGELKKEEEATNPYEVGSLRTVQLYEACIKKINEAYELLQTEEENELKNVDELIKALWDKGQERFSDSRIPQTSFALASIELTNKGFLKGRKEKLKSMKLELERKLRK